MMKLKNVIRCAVRDFLPHKSVRQIIEEQNTRTVWLPGSYGLPKKYVYGKVPGEPLLDHDWHPEPRVHPHCEPETDEAVILRHSAECRSHPGSHGGLCEMCKRLNNPNRMDFLVRLYRDSPDLRKSCLNVGNAQDGSKLYMAATSAYLRQLADIGLVRRERSGRLVNYYPDFSQASCEVGEIAGLIMRRLRLESGDLSFAPIFRVMMGAIRSQVVRSIAAGGDGRVEAIAKRFNLRVCDVRTDLRLAEEGGVLVCSSDDPDGVYSYITPADPIARRIVELS